MKKNLKKPFFANFIEMQNNEAYETLGGTSSKSDTPVTLPSSDPVITLKAPSDSDEGGGPTNPNLDFVTNPSSDLSTNPSADGGLSPVNPF